MKRALLLTLGLLAVSSAAADAQAQGIRYDNIVLGPRGLPSGAANVAVYPATGANVFAISSAVENGTIVTITTATAHGFAQGQSVSVSDVLNAGYNGLYTIASVPSSTTFTYQGTTSFLTASSGGNASVLTQTIYSDQAELHPMANPFQADSLGNYGFWANPGHYIVQLYGAPFITRSFDIFLPCDPSATTGCGTAVATNPLQNTYVQLPQNTFVCGSGNTSIAFNQLLCTLAIASLAQGPTAQGPFANQPPDVVLAGPIVPPGSGAGIRQAATCDAFAGSNGGSCTLTLPSPNHGGTDHPIVVAWCASTQQVCSGAAGSITDTDNNAWSTGNALGASGMVYSISTNTKVGTARDSITCTGPGGIQTGNFKCVSLETNNFTAVDATGGKALGPVGASYETVSASVTTTHPNDLIIAFATQGTDWPCSGSQVFLSPMGFITGGLAANPGSGLDGPVYLSANVIGAPVAGTYNASMTTANIAGGAGCPSTSAGAQSTLGLLALQPSSATAPAEPPTWRYINCVDLGYGLGTGNTIPNCAANDVMIATAPGSSSIAATALIPSSAIGQIQRVSFYIYQTGAGNGCTGNAGVTATFSWTDLNSTAQSITTSSVAMGNALGAGDFTQSQYMVSAKAGTTLNYSTTFTNGSGCATQPTYQLLMRATWGGQ